MQTTDSHGCGEGITTPNIDVLATGRIGDEDFNGVITDTAMNAVTGLFMGLPPVDCKPAYIAVGDGTAAAATTDTALEHETARYPVTQLTQANGITTALLNLPITSQDLEIAEVGVLTKDSVLLCRANVEIVKNQNNVINILWVLSMERGTGNA